MLVGAKKKTVYYRGSGKNPPPPHFKFAETSITRILINWRYVLSETLPFHFVRSFVGSGTSPLVSVLEFQFRFVNGTEFESLHFFGRHSDPPSDDLTNHLNSVCAYAYRLLY